MAMTPKYLSPLEAIQLLNNPNDLLNEIPRYEENPTQIGNYYFFLNRNVVMNVDDLTTDFFSPWTGVGDNAVRVTTKTSYKGLDVNEGVLSLSKSNSEIVLKIIRNTHKNYCFFNREIYYAVCEKKLFSDVLFYYTTPNEFMFLKKFSNPRKLPSEIAVIKNALVNRTTQDARKFLMSSGLQYSRRSLTSVSRSVAEHHKTNQGRKAPMNFHEILDRYLANTDSEEVLDNPTIERLEDGSVKVRVLVGFPVAIDCFASSLPTLEDIADHRADIRRLDYMSRVDGERLMKSYLDSVNVSGSIPLIGNCIMVDTTFSLTSAEYVTIVLGVTETFKSKASGKNSAVMLAYMIHSRKELEDHEHFSRFLNNLFKKYWNSKAIGLIIHDGESSFRCYNTGHFLKDALVLRCDVHRMDNLKSHIDHDGNDYDEVKKMLWGRKVEINGNTVLKNGILNSLSRSEYDSKMNSFINTLAEGKLRRWLEDNVDDLFYHNSMYVKLLGGWPTQFTSTNIIESKNAHIKMIVDHKVPANKLLDLFLDFHREEMNELLKAITGKNSKYTTYQSYTAEAWSNINNVEKRQILSLFGLGAKFRADLLDGVPNFLIPERGITRNELICVIEDLKVFKFENDIFVVSKTNDYDSNHLKMEGHAIKCFNLNCKNTKSTKFCIHQLAAFIFLDEEARKQVVAEADRGRAKVTCSTILRTQSRSHHGTKFARRKGTNFSKNNAPRTYAALLDGTTSSIDDSMDFATASEYEQL